MTKYHKSLSGKWARCDAHERPCPRGTHVNSEVYSEVVSGDFDPKVSSNRESFALHKNLKSLNVKLRSLDEEDAKFKDALKTISDSNEHKKVLEGFLAENQELRSKFVAQRDQVKNKFDVSSNKQPEVVLYNGFSPALLDSLSANSSVKHYNAVVSQSYIYRNKEDWEAEVRKARKSLRQGALANHKAGLAAIKKERFIKNGFFHKKTAPDGGSWDRWEIAREVEHSRQSLHLESFFHVLDSAKLDAKIEPMEEQKEYKYTDAELRVAGI